MRAILLGSTSSLSGGDVVFTLVFAVLFGLVGYRISSRHRVLRGVTPWRFPSLLWAAICFVIGPLGLVVELVAEITTKPRLPSSLGRIAVRFDGQGRATDRSPEQRGLALGTPAGPVPTLAGINAPPPPPPGPPAPLDEQGRTAAFGWYPDPTARHELRYFDGRGWSDHVRDAGERSEDPLATN